MNLSHTDLTNLTKAYIAYARMCHPAESTRLGRQAASFLRCSPFREIREIRVKQKTNDGRRFREICEICVSKNKNSNMRKTKNRQPINLEDKAKTSRNRGCVMKYPWMRNEISANI